MAAYYFWFVYFIVSDVENVFVDIFYILFYYMVLTATVGATPIIVAVGHVYFFLHQREKEEIPFSMAS